MSDNQLKKEKISEIVTAAVKGAVSTVPVVGGMAAEIGALFFDPLKKRNEIWKAAVEEAIQSLHEKTGKLPEQLAKDDKFLSMLYHATTVAWKNHQKEKIRFLKDGLISTGESLSISDDLFFLFFRYIDELTVSHVRILSIINKHIGQFARCKTLEQVYHQFQSVEGDILSRRDFRVYLEDLHSRLLLHRGDLEDYPEYLSKVSHIVTEGSSMRKIKVTEIGRNFLKFIKEEGGPNKANSADS